MTYARAMERLAQWLKDTSTDQKTLAQRCGVSAGLISQYIKGRTKPSFETLVVLSRETGVSLAELVAEFEPKPSRRARRATPALSV